MNKIIKLLMVSPDNNNKFYSMTEKGDGTFDAHYGRVGSNGVHETYPMSMWDKKYKEKTGKKGYRDVTELVSVSKHIVESDSVVKLAGASKAVIELVNLLQSCARGTVSANYTVKVADVTEKQVLAAQEVLNRLIAASTTTLNKPSINQDLLQMYQIIPRKMKDTRLHLLQDTDDAQKFQKLLASEQDLLDVMQTQVQQQKTTQQPDQPTDTLASYGISITEATDDQIQEIRKNTDLDITKVAKIYRVINHKTEQQFNSSIGNVKLMYHGSRTQNWWSIINQGLRIRPSNAIHTGSMFSDGIYGADLARKSLGYTDGGFWAGGSAPKKFLGIYSFSLGKEWNIFENGKVTYQHWMSKITQAQVEAKKCNSVFAKGGADLKNNEYIIYKENQCTIKYLVEMK